MWEINNSTQAINFSRAVILGILFCLLYSIFSSIRKAGKDSFTAVLLEDLLYFIIITPVLFLFLLSTTNGELRFYILFGILIGFALLKVTLYKIFTFVFTKIFSSIFKVFISVGKYKDKIINLISVKSKVFFKKTAFFLKKAVNTLKKLLKKQ